MACPLLKEVVVQRYEKLPLFAFIHVHLHKKLGSQEASRVLNVLLRRRLNVG